MPATRFQTDLNCGKCVAKVAPLLNADRDVVSWSVDTSTPDKVLTVQGPRIDERRVAGLVQQAGFHVLARLDDPAVDSAAATQAVADEPRRSWWATYRPLLLIVAYLVGGSLLLASGPAGFDWRTAMNLFMAGFFLVFSYFKLLDVEGFATAFAGYDLLARRSRAYARLYPFIELALGVAYLAQWAPVATNALALVIMLLGLAGVAQSLLRGQTIKCACLGTGFNLPMSTVTLIEDGLMAAMAGGMLLLHWR